MEERRGSRKPSSKPGEEKSDFGRRPVSQELPHLQRGSPDLERFS